MKKKYYLKLDIIRIVACLLVVLYHLNYLKGGFLAVCTFFVLSGYLETVSSLKNKSFSIKDYYVKRLKRIYLPLLIVVSLTIITFKCFPNLHWLNLKQESISALLGYNNFWQLKANLNYFTKSINSPLTHLWYISILMQIDLIFPLIFSLFKKINKTIGKDISLIIVFILGIISTIGLYIASKNYSIMTIYYNTIFRVFSFIWGVFIALMQYRHMNKLSKKFKNENNEIFIIYLLSLLTICLFIPKSQTLYPLFMIISTFISCRLIEYSINISSIKGTITSFIKKLASITYEVYLIHFPVIYFVYKLKIANSLRIVLIIVITLILSILIHKLLNNKKNNYLKLFIILLIVLPGLYFIIIEKDSSKEIALLERSLKSKEGLMLKKNKEYLNNSKEEDSKWQAMLEDMSVKEDEAVKERLKEMPIVGIGDSVFLDAVDLLYDKFPNGYFDGKVSRSLTGGLGIIRDLKDSGKLPHDVILALAINGDYSDRKNRELMDLMEDREVYWINAVGADDPSFNENFKNFAKEFPNIHIVDWEGKAKNHPEYFYADGIHPKGEGIKAYADVVYDTVYENNIKLYREEKEELIKKKQEEEKKKISFYGNDALINSYELLHKKYKTASYNTITTNNYNKIYNDIKDKIDKNVLEYKIVFIFDNEIKMTDDDYQKIIDLCKDHEIYIFNITGEKYKFDNNKVKVIDFSKEIKKHKEYMMIDNTHLSREGNIALVEKIEKNLS